MKILVAKSAGFCFGVNKAVEAVNRLLGEGRGVCTLGPVIHNPHVVEKLKARGVRVIDEPSEAPEGSVVVVRSHGVPKSVYQEIKKRGWNSATPPARLSQKYTKLCPANPRTALWL